VAQRCGRFAARAGDSEPAIATAALDEIERGIGDAMLTAALQSTAAGCWLDSGRQQKPTEQVRASRLPSSSVKG